MTPKKEILDTGLTARVITVALSDEHDEIYIPSSTYSDLRIRSGLTDGEIFTLYAHGGPVAA